MPFVIGVIVAVALTTAFYSFLTFIFVRKPVRANRLSVCVSLIVASFISLIVASLIMAAKGEFTTAIGVTVIIYITAMVRTRKSIIRKKQEQLAYQANEAAADAGIKFKLDGVNDVLRVYDDKIAITPKTNTASVLVRGLKGTKSIPYSSITAVQLRLANPINGYIQFSILGGVEAKGGVIAAISDENTCFFTQPQNDIARQIADFVENRLLRPGQQNVASENLAAQLEQLAQLSKDGTLSSEEYLAAKEAAIARFNPRT